MKFRNRFVFIFFLQLVVKAGDFSFTGLFDYSLRGILFSVGFIAYFLVVWYVAEFLNNRIEQRQKKLNRKHSIYYLFVFHLLFGFLACFTANWLYQTIDLHLSQNPETWKGVNLLNPELTMSLWMFYMMVFSVDSFYKLTLINKEKKIKLEKLKKEHALAQYHNLKSQIEPHFLFNSLSVLSSLIYSDKELASEFVLKLSKILRFVIEKNNFLLVPLQEELAFVEDYIFLIKTRFEDEIVIEIKVDENVKAECYVPPAAIQSLVENAIKHNKFTSEKQLSVSIYNDKDTITITNNVNLRDDNESSTGLGLNNLKSRYSHFTSKEVSIVRDKDRFTVSLPLLTKKEYESSNI